MNRYDFLKIAAALVAAAALTGCSLLKVSVSSGDPLSKEDMNVRTMTRGFYYQMAGEVTRAADSIASSAGTTAERMAAIRWKIRATRAGVTAAMQGIPEVALADMWILCRRMSDAFAAAPDSLLFGDRSDLAREVTARLDRQAAQLAENSLSSERYRLMSSFVEKFVRENPVTADAEAVNTSYAWLEYMRANGVEHDAAVGSIAEVLADVNDRMSGHTQQLANSVGWSKDILEIQLQQDSIRSQLGRQLDSLERHINRVVTVAEHAPEISDHMIRELSAQVTQVIYTVNSSVDNAFANLDAQRQQLQQYITLERQSVIDQAREAADLAVQNLLDQIPALIGKVLFYLVLALVVLLGLPFAAGFWLGRFRERAREKRKNS